MAKSVVGLNIKIGANVATLQRDLGKASNSVRQFSKNATGAASGVSALNRATSSLGSGMSRMSGVVVSQAKSLVAIAAATVAATLSIRGLIGAFSEIDKIAKLADITGASTEALVAFRKAAELSGVDVEKFDVAFKKMVRSIGDAKAGTGEAKQALERLGLSVGALASGTPEEAFKQIADAINGLGTQSEKAAAAAAIFGRAGVDLLPTLALGRAGLDAMREKVDRLRQSFSRVDAAKVEEANDAITNMQAAFKGLTTILAIEFAPAVAAAADGVSGVISAMRNLDAGTVRTAAQVAAFTLGVGAVVLILPKVIAGFYATVAALKALTVAATFAQAATGVGLVKALVGIAVGAGAAYAAGKAFDKMTASIAVASKEVKKTSDEIEELEETTTSVADAMSKVDEVAEKWKSIGERIRDSVATPTEQLREKLAEIRGALAAGAIDFETYGRAIRSAVEEFGELSKAKDAFSATPSIGAAVRGTSGGFAAVQGGQQLMKDLVAHAKKKEDSDKRREKLLADMLGELEAIAESSAKPLKVKEHDII